jgi:hypothetical protein
LKPGLVAISEMPKVVAALFQAPVSGNAKVVVQKIRLATP